MSKSIDHLVDTLHDFYRNELQIEGNIALHEPLFEGNEWVYVKECIDTGWVSTAGKYVNQIEEMIARQCNTKYAVAVVNGTAALHAALLAHGVTKDDAVICPALTFIATANAISYCGAKPYFVDIDEKFFCLDAIKLKHIFHTECEKTAKGLIHKATGRRIKAMVPVHIFGHPADMDSLCEIAQEYDIAIIEDAAEALGSTYKSKPCGSLSSAGVLSFNGNKIMTTGGGGMIVTDNEELAHKLKHITTTARVSDGWWFSHDEVGFNYRMPNINAALGCAQLEKLPDFVKRKRTLTDLYKNLFESMSGVSFHQEPDYANSNYWLNALLMKDATDRDTFLEQTNARNIQTRPAWRLLCDQALYDDAIKAQDLSNARQAVAQIVNIPSSPQLIKPEYS